MSMLELTSDQEKAVLGSSEPVPILAKASSRRFLLITEEAYQKIQELLKVDEVEDSLFECEDLPDEA